MNTKKKTTQSLGTIKGNDLLINSKNKLGKHSDVVQTGTGKHKNKKAYDRKANKRAIRKEMNTYPTSNGSYNLNLNMVINPQNLVLPFSNFHLVRYV